MFRRFLMLWELWYKVKKIWETELYLQYWATYMKCTMKGWKEIRWSANSTSQWWDDKGLLFSILMAFTICLTRGVHQYTGSISKQTNMENTVPCSLSHNHHSSRKKCFPSPSLPCIGIQSPSGKRMEREVAWGREAPRLLEDRTAHWKRRRETSFLVLDS